ncbi:MAG TPA: hypothetical protein VHC70_14175 [Phycisphaerales bacterium]|jgi:hypothetical protein|nr:hypothetical protein [Phycisphaerales bacterium]
MSNVSPISGSIPFHIAKAYGIQPGQGAAGAQAAQPGASIRAAEPQGGRLPTAAQRLVAAVVPGKVDFSGDSPRQVGGGGAATSALPLYRHPAERNAAATAVSIGKSLDVTG